MSERFARPRSKSKLLSSCARMTMVPMTPAHRPRLPTKPTRPPRATCMPAAATSMSEASQPAGRATSAAMAAQRSGSWRDRSRPARKGAVVSATNACGGGGGDTLGSRRPTLSRFDVCAHALMACDTVGRSGNRTIVNDSRMASSVVCTCCDSSAMDGEYTGGVVDSRKSDDSTPGGRLKLLAEADMCAHVLCGRHGTLAMV